MDDYISVFDRWTKSIDFMSNGGSAMQGSKNHEGGTTEAEDEDATTNCVS